MLTWRCILHCDEHGEGTYTQVTRAANAHMTATGHGTLVEGRGVRQRHEGGRVVNERVGGAG